MSEQAKQHAQEILEVAAFLAATRIQGWANPLVIKLTDAAFFLDETRREKPTYQVTLSEHEGRGE